MDADEQDHVDSGDLAAATDQLDDGERAEAESATDESSSTDEEPSVKTLRLETRGKAPPNRKEDSKRKGKEIPKSKERRVRATHVTMMPADPIISQMDK